MIALIQMDFLQIGQGHGTCVYDVDVCVPLNGLKVGTKQNNLNL